MVRSDIELLAPAGSWEALVAAVQNGADAVYLAGKAFGARYYAANFDKEELQAAVKYAHTRGVKIYVTVNTLIADCELEDAGHYINFLYEIGVDAIIVQDLGIVKLVQDLFPDLEMHASTQMTIHNAAGAQFLKSQGISRVVLAREVSLEDIRSIRQKTAVELEVFIHGALCISYSGQCLMSSMIGGRSGNRGKCAQPCRMKYRLVDAQGKEIPYGNFGEHLLSPRDLNTIAYLPEILTSGVASLKLEGRMKRPEYVATVIRVYRQAIDRYLANPAEYEVKPREMRDLAQIFNRDFTPGYFLGNQGADLMSYKRPNNRGLFLGRINKVSPDGKLVTLRLAENLAVNDGIEIWVSKGGRQGSTITKLWVHGQPVHEAEAGQEVTIEIPGRARAGDRIFKTHDARLIARAQESYKNVNAEQKIPLKMTVRVTQGQPLSLIAEDDRGNVVRVKTSFIAEKAIKRPLTAEVVKEQLSRLGNTLFNIGEFDCQIEGEVMVPLSELNNVRRDAVACLEELRQSLFGRKPVDAWVISQYLERNTERRQIRKKELSLAVAVGEIKSGLAAVEAGAQRLYLYTAPFRSQRNQTGTIHALLKSAAENRCDLVIALPRIWHQREAERMEKLIKQYEVLGIQGYLVGNIGTLQLLRDLGVTKQIYADYPLNVFNSLAIKLLEGQEGITSITLSPELTFEQIASLVLSQETQLECIVHGSLPLMLSEYCAVGALLGGRTAEKACSKPCLQGKYGLKDRLNLIFPLEMDENCRMHVYNSKELCLIEELEHFHKTGITSLRIEARKNSHEEIKFITGIYRQALTGFASGALDKDDLTRLKEKLEQKNSAGFTKGHYFRGVL